MITPQLIELFIYVLVYVAGIGTGFMLIPSNDKLKKIYYMRGRVHGLEFRNIVIRELATRIKDLESKLNQAQENG